MKNDTDDLLQRLRQGDESCRRQLLERHQTKLHTMISLRMPAPLARRVDPSDVVQEVLLQANDHLLDFTNNPHGSYYLWLRKIAMNRLLDLYRFHVKADRRSTRREIPLDMHLADDSVAQLAQHLLAGSGSTPSRQLLQEELRHRVQSALTRLGPRDREILILRHVEQLTAREIAEFLDESISAVKMRHLRALQRVRALLDETGAEST